MPDFDTRTPQEERNKPLRLRIALIASKLRILLTAINLHIPLIGNRVRSLLITSKGSLLLVVERLRSSLVASRPHTLLVSGGILLLVAVVVSIVWLGFGSRQDSFDAATGSLTPDQGWQERGAEPKSATPVGPGQKLAFGIEGGGLYAMDPNGSNATQLTDGVSPAWSPDGERVAYTRYLKEPNPAASSAPESVEADPYKETPYIFVIDADGSGGKQLLDRAAVGPEWSPDGTEIAFTLAEDNEDRGYCGIYIMDADGSGTP